MKSDFSVCGYSHCGGFLAAGGSNGEIVVWNLTNNQIIREGKGGDNDAQCITSISWNPMNNGELAYTDNTGQFGLAVNIFDDDAADDLLNNEAEEMNGNEDVDFGDSKQRNSHNFLSH